MLRTIFTAFAFMLTPFLAVADESGSVTLEIDGASYEFPLDARQSDWSGALAYGSINIYTKPTDEATWALFKRLTLGFGIMSEQVDAPEISLSRMVDGELVKLFGNKDTNASIFVEQVTGEGEFLSLTGSFSSDLGTSKNYGGDIDLSAPVTVNGTFSVVLGPVE